MVVWYPVYSRGRDVYHAPGTVTPRHLQDIARPLDVRGVDVLGRVERQRRSGVDHEVHTLDGPVHERLVTNVALYDLDPTPLRIVELLDVQRDERVPALIEVPDEVDPQKPGSASDKNPLLLHLKRRLSPRLTLLVNAAYPRASTHRSILITLLVRLCYSIRLINRYGSPRPILRGCGRMWLPSPRSRPPAP